MRIRERDVSGECAPLEVLRQASEIAVLLKTGTIFEDSPLGLDKWLAALWLLVNCKNGISSTKSPAILDYPEVRVVHGASSASPCTRFVRQALRRG